MFLIWHVFPFPLLNQLGKVNELLIKHNLSVLAEENKEEDVVEEHVEEKTGFKADCIFTADNLEAALNLVMISSKLENKNKKQMKKNSIAHTWLYIVPGIHKKKIDTCLCSFISKSQTR